MRSSIMISMDANNLANNHDKHYEFRGSKTMEIGRTPRGHEPEAAPIENMPLS